MFKISRLFLVVLMAASVVVGGCGTTARDVQTGTTLASLAGTPGAGIISLSAAAVGLLTKLTYKMSDDLKEQVKVASQDKTIGALMKRLVANRKRFESGDWGESDELRIRNIAAYEAGKTVGIKYGKDREALIYVYSQDAKVVFIETQAEFDKRQTAKVEPAKQ